MYNDLRVAFGHLLPRFIFDFFFDLLKFFFLGLIFPFLLFFEFLILLLAFYGAVVSRFFSRRVFAAFQAMRRCFAHDIFDPDASRWLFRDDLLNSPRHMRFDVLDLAFAA